jgi:two-component system, OmpR family, sensor histidine kinase KdpD
LQFWRKARGNLKQMTEPSKSQKFWRFWQTVQRCALGMLAVLLVTWVAFQLHLNFLIVSFCYLIVLVLQSLAGDFASSAVVALAAVACLDYFFVDPLFSFQVNSPLYIVGLGSFLITGLVITKLVTKARAGAELSRLHHKRIERLYEFGQELLALEPANGSSQILEPFCGALGIKAVCFFDAADAEVYVAGNAGEELETKTGQAFLQDKDCDDLEKNLVARCIRVSGRTIGAIGFEGLEDPGLMAGPLASLAAAHLERTRSFKHASQAAAMAQSESYRTVILDALAHEFKTPLSTILTAAGALREVPSLGPQHHEMTEIVESEAARLSRLTSRLIRTARLEREEIKPWIELIDVSAVVAETVDQYARLSAGRRIVVSQECASTDVMADPELLRLAISQLLDNACKYSTPGSIVSLKIAREHDGIVVRVVSNGNPIPTTERNRIFERFYRGIDGRRSGPGSGLGLFVARKIALALGGSIDLDDEDPGATNGTVFRLALPVPERERDDIAAAV